MFHSVHWLFRKTGTMGTLARQAEIVRAPRGRFCGNPEVYHPGKYLRLYTQNPSIQCIAGWKRVRNAVHLNISTMRTPFPRVPLEVTPAWPVHFGIGAISLVPMSL